MKIIDVKQRLSSLIIDKYKAEYLFDEFEYVGLTDFITQLVFEVVKQQFVASLSTMSLHQNVVIKEKDSIATDAAYAELKRNHSQAVKDQNELREMIGADIQKKDVAAARREGYQYNTLEFRQIQSRTEIPIIKSLSQGRMAESKKVSRKNFREIFNEYDRYICGLIDEIAPSSEKIIMNSIDFYDLQNRMMIESTYDLAAEMERTGLHEYPALKASCFVQGFHGNGVTLQNRFLLQKTKWFPFVFGEKQKQYDFQVKRLYHVLQLKKTVMDDFYAQIESCQLGNDDILTFITEEHNPFLAFTRDKQWSDSRIDLSRKVLRSFWVS